MVESIDPEQIDSLPLKKDDVVIGNDSVVVPETYVQAVAEQLSHVQTTEKEEEKKEAEKEHLEDIETENLGKIDQGNLSSEVERVLRRG